MRASMLSPMMSAQCLSALVLSSIRQGYIPQQDNRSADGPEVEMIL